MDEKKQKQLVGAKIKSLREENGMTQEALAKASGKSSAAYVALIESGERNVSMVDLLKIAKALGTTASNLVREEQETRLPQVDSTTKFRKGSYSFDEEQVLRFEEEFKLGRNRPELGTNLAEPRTKLAEAEGEKTWKDLGKEKIPVMLNDIVSALGIPVRAVDIDDIEGCTMNHGGGEIYIMYNKKHPRNRQRFTVAHEIGHVVLHTKGTEKNEAQPSQASQEKEADIFANALLVPREHLKKFLKNKDKTLMDICKKYEVSREVATIAVLSQKGLLDKLKAEETTIDF